MTKIIGLTGGIGSGKTTIATYFQSLGIPVYIADVEAKKIMRNSEIIQKIKNVFGNEIFEAEELNRAKLSQIVFNNSEKLKKLNSIVHPAVKLDFQNWLSKHKTDSFIIYESAILFESKSYKNCDFIISVCSPLETRIQRVIERDGLTKDQVLNRIHAQLSDEERILKSDFVIENIDFDKTKSQVVKILKILKIKQNLR